MRAIPILLAAFTAITTSASAETINVSKLKCSEFIASGADNIGLILMWLLGHYHDEEETMQIDLAKFKSVGEKIGKHCAENPDDTMDNVAEKFMSE